MVHETRTQVQANVSAEEEKAGSGTKKHKVADSKLSDEVSNKKAKPEHEDNSTNGHPNNGKSAADAVAEFAEFCKAIKEHLSIEQMREILEANDIDIVESDDAVVPQCQDVLFYGVLEKCPICGGTLEYKGNNYKCVGVYSEWSTCTFSTRDPQRKQEPLKLPDSIKKSSVSDLIKSQQDQKHRPHQLASVDKFFARMTFSLSGRLSRTHQYWKTNIEKHGGKVANTLAGVTCVVVSPAERDRGGSSKVAEAIGIGIPIVRETWLSDSIEKQEAQPLEAYDIVSDLAVAGKGIPWDKQDPSEEALESLSAELKLYGKRGVYKDTMLQEKGGKIFEKDGLLFNCAFSVCDQGRGVNEYAIMQLITVPEQNLHLYFKKGKVGDDPQAEERLKEWEKVDDAVKEFARLFEEMTGNDFELWEREKKFEKKTEKFYPIDMDDGYDVRYGGLGLRQLGIAATHCKLEPLVTNFMKALCSQLIYKYALMEMGMDSPDLPMGMLTVLHVKRCEDILLKFIEALKLTKEMGQKGEATWSDFNQRQKGEAIWSDFSQRFFTLMHSTRPFIFRDYQELADHAAAALETVRDINVASRLIGDMTGPTIDDPLFDHYKALGCSVMPLDKETSDYKMILSYLEKTYEPVKVGDISYGVSVENIYSVESGACLSYDEIKKLPNKVLLWCGTRSSNLLRHLHKGFMPAICSLPVPGYMFGRAIVCSDAAAEAASYGFRAVDRPEGFLVLAVVSLGEEIIELKSPPEDTGSLEEKKLGVKGLGRKKTDESEHFVWKDDIKVPCGRIIPSGHKDSPLEYNEYAVYDPKQASIMFLVGVKFEVKGVVMDTEE